MYGEKIEDILLDIERTEVHLAGGSTVGIVLSIVNSLIIYIANLTIEKKKYEEVRSQVESILKEAEEIKRKSIAVIDKDKIILDKILLAYKIKKDYETKYQNVLKEAVNFCMDVLNIAFETYNLSKKINEVGNKLLESDFKICKYYAYASVKSAVENVKVNLYEIKDKDYKDLTEKKYKQILQEIELNQ